MKDKISLNTSNVYIYEKETYEEQCGLVFSFSGLDSTSLNLILI